MEKKENRPVHAAAKVAMKRVELIDRILKQIDNGYLDLNKTDDPEELEVIKRLLIKNRMWLTEKWL